MMCLAISVDLRSLARQQLAPQQRRVAHLLGEGWTNCQIANQLNILPETVKAHVRSLALRLGIQGGAGVRRRVVIALSDNRPKHPLPALPPNLRRIAEMLGRGLTFPQMSRETGRSTHGLRVRAVELYNRTGVWSSLELIARYDLSPAASSAA
jgi:DNA-binding NarL/FixJ family response regulator